MVRSTWLCLGVLLACGDSESGKKLPQIDAGVTDGGVDGGAAGEGLRLHPDGRFFRDGAGRAVIFRGLNARIEGVFDVTFDDGRMPVETVPSFGEADCRRMAELGFTLLRLPINWSGIEPEKDRFDEAYLKRVDAVIACLKQQGIYTLVDLHQDAYSKEIGEDGAPLWAIVPEPEMLLEGPLTEGELTGRRISAPVVAAFQSFFADGDPHGLQAQYIEMLEHVAARYADEPFVVGLDLFNEPFTSPKTLAPFNARAGAAVRKVAPDLTVVFEPTGAWSRAGGEAVAGPFPVDNAVFAPHLYAVSIEGTDEERANVTREALLPSFQAATREAQAWGTAWLIGELGAGPSTANYETILRLYYDLQDEFLVSSALWLWKENSQGSWGLFDDVDGTWVERPRMVELVSRPYATRIAGTPTQMGFSGTTFSLDYQDALDAPNVIFVPERFAVDAVTCDGQAVEASATHGMLHIVCPEGSAHALRVELTNAE